jgi:RNA polymerase-binding transcription factor DksA
MEETAALVSRLAGEGERTSALIDDLRSELAGIAESTAAGPDDEHDVEGSTVAYERARVQALLAGAERTLAGIEAALSRTRGAGSGSGTGSGSLLMRCELCDSPIPFERLLALPGTDVCVNCAARR